MLLQLLAEPDPDLWCCKGFLAASSDDGTVSVLDLSKYEDGVDIEKEGGNDTKVPSDSATLEEDQIALTQCLERGETSPDSVVFQPGLHATRVLRGHWYLHVCV